MAKTSAKSPLGLCQQAYEEIHGETRDEELSSELLSNILQGIIMSTERESRWL